MQRWFRLVSTAALAVCLCACRLDAQVDVVVETNGSGTVTVNIAADAEVIEEAPSLPSDLRFEDLSKAGWQTAGPIASPDGGMTIELVRPFSTVTEANQVLAQLSGPDGPFADLMVSQRKAFAKVNTRFSGKIRLPRGVSSFADGELLALTGGTIPYEGALAERELTLDQALGLRLSISVPGTAEVSNGLVSPITGDGFDTRTTVDWTAELSGSAVTEGGQAVTLEAELENSAARQAARFREFAPWALAAWATLFCLVIVPIALLVRRRHRIREARQK